MLVMTHEILEAARDGNMLPLLEMLVEQARKNEVKLVGGSRFEVRQDRNILDVTSSTSVFRRHVVGPRSMHLEFDLELVPGEQFLRRQRLSSRRAGNRKRRTTRRHLRMLAHRRAKALFKRPPREDDDGYSFYDEFGYSPDYNPDEE